MSGLRSLLKHLVPSTLMQQKLGTKGCVLLTFDDGPHPAITPRVMNLLERHGARGLFFVPGTRIDRAPWLLREILDRGHGLGNHGFSHLPCSRLSYVQIVDEIRRGADAIEHVCGVRTALFRPPLGDVTLNLFVAARRARHRIFRWSIDTGESGHSQGASADALARGLLAGIRDRAIVLSHDDQQEVPRMLEQILPSLVERGFDLRAGLASTRWCGE